MKYPCERCKGRGWDPPKRPDSFPDACAWCKGAGVLTTGRLASVIHVPRHAVYDLERGRVGVDRAVALLDGFARYMPGVLGISTLAARVALFIP